MKDQHQELLNLIKETDKSAKCMLELATPTHIQFLTIQGKYQTKTSK